MIIDGHARKMGVDITAVLPPLDDVGHLFSAGREVAVELGADGVVLEVGVVVVGDGGGFGDCIAD